MTPVAFLARARDVLPPALARWSDALVGAALACAVDPLLLSAIIWRETRGGNAKGLDKPGPGGRGDGGHGHGLGQIDDRTHVEFIAARDAWGRPLWALPAFNLLYAAHVLKHALSALEDDEVAAVAAYNAGEGRVRRALTSLEPGAPLAARIALLDSLTTGRNYVSDVLTTRARWLRPVGGPPAVS